MTEMKQFLYCLVVFLWLAFLSLPSLATAWSHPSDAEPIQLGMDKDGILTHLNHDWYYRFQLPSSANLTFTFTHDRDIGSLPVWSVELMDPNENQILTRDVTLSDYGFTCSVDLAPSASGKYGPYYYVAVHGKADTDVTSQGYTISVSNPNLIVRMGSYYARIGDACAAANASYNQIFPGCFTFNEDVTYGGEGIVVIDGGNEDVNCQTIIRGSLRVRNGQMNVSRVALRPRSGSTTWSCRSLTQ